MTCAPEIIMLGTGSAFPVRSYNTCFVLRDGTLEMLVDAGGGNGIIGRMHTCDVDVASLTHFFITHAHTDHILGAVWVVRALLRTFDTGARSEPLTVLGNKAVIECLDTICKLTLLPDHYERFRKHTNCVEIKDGQSLCLKGHDFFFFDVGSANVLQTGFKVRLTNGKTFATLGDESLTQWNVSKCLGVDWLMCGAFCRHADADIFKPYEKHHHTVRDVARVAAKAAIPHLILVHAEDSDPVSRSTAYAVEASLYYEGRIFTPMDGDVIRPI